MSSAEPSGACSSTVLNDEQKKAVDAAIAGRNLFITGGAGVGKTVVLREIARRLGSDCIVAAPTGMAARGAGGVTVHRLLARNGQGLVGARTLVIDEASMLAPDLVSRVDRTAQRARNHAAPWGGLQVVLIGDLCQLPPVVRAGPHAFHIRSRYGKVPYFFAADVFHGFSMIELTTIVRQRDVDFVNALNDVRNGSLSAATAALLNSRVSVRPPGAPVLVTKNVRADAINREELDRLKAPAHTFIADIEGAVTESEYPAEAHLTLKVGARVTALKNHGAYDNGDTGLVERIDFPNKLVRVRLDRGGYVEIAPDKWPIIEYSTHRDAQGIKRTEKTVVGTFTQLPLRLAWAISIHKSQGLTLDRAHVDFDTGTFAHGQAYVALSRLRTLAGLTLERPVMPRDVIFDPRSQGFRRVFRPLLATTAAASSTPNAA